MYTFGLYLQNDSADKQGSRQGIDNSFTTRRYDEIYLYFYVMHTQIIKITHEGCVILVK